jgi:hypothetical protein
MLEGGEMTANEWNTQHQIGTGVVVKLDDGKLWHTRTRSTAWELGNGQAVVMLEGRSGGYALSRVRPMERQETALG